jgi:hypothetical protein
VNPTKQGPCQREKPLFSAKPGNPLRNWCSQFHPAAQVLRGSGQKKFANICHPPPATERNSDWHSIFESPGKLG